MHFLAIVLTAWGVQAETSISTFELPFFGVHRGGAGWRPEHTIETYREVVQRWPEALLECDVRLTRDGAVVLHHDRTVDRTTDGTGPIADRTLAEVRALDAGYRFTRDGGKTFPYRGKDLRIATLDELLRACPDSHILIEPKNQPGVVAAMIAVIRRHGAEKRVLIASFQPEMMEEVRRLMPEAATCFSMTTGMRLLTALRGGAWDSYTPEDDVLALAKPMLRQYQITREDIARMQQKGIQVLLYDADDEAAIREALALGVNAVLTDHPDLLDAVLASARPPNVTIR
jgi:glycerophosphoryl diester phosphodiesterase